MKEIGGFFEFELPMKKEYHSKAIKLNYGRNALEYILKSNKYEKIYVPYYICNSILEPIKKLDIPFEKYKIDCKFEPIFNYENMDKKSLFLYVNYFGISNINVKNIIEISKKNKFDLCIDNTQAFFDMPKGETHTIYSARKFFGVPDGAYLYTKDTLDLKLDIEIAYKNCEHLIKRIDVGCNKAYANFKEISIKHRGQDVREMSNLSQRILKSIDYDEVSYIRNNNFGYIHNMLKKYNEIEIDLNSIKCPMIYPLVNRNLSRLCEFFIKNGIYTARYWPGIENELSEDDFENIVVNNLIAIPIDQRYGVEDMDRIINIFNKYIESIEVKDDIY